MTKYCVMPNFKAFLAKVKINQKWGVHRDDVPAGLQPSSGVENDLTGGSSISTDGIVKRPNERAAAREVSSPWGSGDPCLGCSS